MITAAISDCQNNDIIIVMAVEVKLKFLKEMYGIEEKLCEL